MRLLQFSRRHGTTLFWFSGICTLLSLISLDLVGTLVGGAICLLGHREGWATRQHPAAPAALQQAAHAELGILAVIAVYCAIQLLLTDASTLLGRPAYQPLVSQISPADQQAMAAYLQPILQAFYGGVILLSLLYQGTLFLLYRRAARRHSASPSTNPNN